VHGDRREQATGDLKIRDRDPVITIGFPADF
jgi:hypothetical protein